MLSAEIQNGVLVKHNVKSEFYLFGVLVVYSIHTELIFLTFSNGCI